MGVYENAVREHFPIHDRRSRDTAVSRAVKDIEKISIRRFLKAAGGAGRPEISEGEYKRVELLVQKLARQQKGLLFDIHQNLAKLAQREVEAEVLCRCFKAANDRSLFQSSRWPDYTQWIDEMSELMTPWAEWFESQHPELGEDIYFLDTFWHYFQQSETLWLMLDVAGLLQQLELLDAKLTKQLRAHGVTLRPNPWYQVSVADTLLEQQPWVGEFVYAEPLLMGDLRATVERAVAESQAVADTDKPSFEALPFTHS